MSKILWLSDGPVLNTGFSGQSLGICNTLADDGHDVHFLQHTSGGQTLKPGARLMDDTEFKFHLHGNGLQPYAADIIEHRLRELKADIFGVLLDTFMLFPAYLSKDFSPTRAQVFYFPSDGGGNLPAGCENILRKFSHPIAMSKFAQRQAKEVHGLDTGYIPHYVDTNMIRPLSDEEKFNLKRKYGLLGKIVIGSVYRNQGRKMSDRYFDAFALAAKQLPNAVFFLHTDPTDPAGYFDTFRKIQELNLQNRVVFTGMKYFKGFTYKEMNEIYNAMDMFYLGTSGEGFGIPIIEAMSAGVPCLVTDYTTTQELVTDHKAGEGVKMDAEILGSWHVKRGVVDIQDSADKIIKLAKDENLRREYGNNGRKAVLKNYSLEVVGEQWRQLIRRL